MGKIPSHSWGGSSPQNGKITRLCKVDGEERDRRVVLCVDGDTGEELGWIIESVDKPPHPKEWARLYKDTCRGIAFDGRFAAETRVMLWLLYNVQYGNFVGKSRKMVAEELELDRGTVGRVVKLMLESSLLQEDTYKGVRGFRLSPNFVFLGSRRSKEVRLAIWNEKLTKRRLREDERERA